MTSNGGGGRKDHTLLDIHPTAELKFPFELKKQSSCSLQLTNKTSNEYVAFKFKTTNHERYSVRPNMGIVMPGKTCDVTVTMQAQKDVPQANVLSKDKFLLQSVVAPHGSTTNSITREMFKKEAGKVVEEFKFKVMYVVPVADPDPPPPMPVPEVIKVKCQICDMDSHLADMCPFMYTICKVPNCSGIRKLYISKTENNLDRKFLMCQYNQCMGFQWLSDAILEALNDSNSSPTMHDQNQRCSQCGDIGQCSCVEISESINKYSPAENEVKITSQNKKESEGSMKYLKCLIPPKKVSKV